MKILGLDWIGCIILTCSITRVIYDLLVVDYFIRFVWAKNYLKHIAYEVFNIYEKYIFLIFRYNKVIYFNNSSYFINQEV